MPLLRRRTRKPAPALPVLHLSGPRLRQTFEHLVQAAEATGGVERYVGALALKASLFEEIFGKGRLEAAQPEEFRDLAAFVTPARRRIAPYLQAGGFARLHAAIAELMQGWADVTDADARLAAFTACFPEDREHRWVRDLGAEILHFTAPDRYPLMTRWMWDAGVGTGVIREIWFEDAPEIEALTDEYATFAALGEELGGFLTENGVFRDHAFYADLLCAHVYAGYINDHGSQYLKADFAGTADPMLHTRRMLGLDAIDTESGRTRLKLIDGTAHTIAAEPALLN